MMDDLDNVLPNPLINMAIDPTGPGVPALDPTITWGGVRLEDRPPPSPMVTSFDPGSSRFALGNNVLGANPPGVTALADTGKAMASDMSGFKGDMPSPSTARPVSFSYDDKKAMEAYIRDAAVKRGIDPDIAVRVSKSEGFNTYNSLVDLDANGKPFSFGPYQLSYRGGVGNRFTAATGLDARDPLTVREQIDFALDHAKKYGWGEWHGWKGDPKAGISDSEWKGTDWTGRTMSSGDSLGGSIGDSGGGSTVPQSMKSLVPGRKALEAPDWGPSVEDPESKNFAELLQNSTLKDNMAKLYPLMLLQSLAPKHKFTPVEYDPFKLVPDLMGTKSRA